MSSAETSHRIESPLRRARLLLLADDLTGTADSAVSCVAGGLSAQVLLTPEAADEDVVAVDLDSRSMTPGEAAQRHVDCLTQWQGCYTHLFKKMDSTLRGNAAAEIAALIPLAGMAIVAPAFPATGRTTRQGRQYLHDHPVEACDVWRNEGLTGCADMVAMLKAEGVETALLTLDILHQPATSVAARIQQWQQQGIKAVVCDALTEEDLDHLARATATLDQIFWAGSGGLGQTLSAALPALQIDQHADTSEPARDTERPTLFVIGSMSTLSHAQADTLQAAAGHALVAIDIEVTQLLESASMSALQALCLPIEQTLKQGRDVLIRLAQSQQRQIADASRISQRLGEMLAPQLRHVGRLIATGGATARALLTAGDMTRLTLLDAPDIGMARMVTAGSPVLEVITKAGAFGEQDALLRLWQTTRHSRSFCTPTGNTHMTDHPVIGITMGDAAGVGPEVIIKSLARAGLHDQCRPLVIGDATRLRDAASRLGSSIIIRAIERPDQASFTPGTIDCIDLGLIPLDLPYGQISPIAGDAAYQYIARTVELTRAGELDAICTAPLNKAALHAGGHIFPGHTELLAHLTGIDEVSMMLVTPKMRVIHVTTHMGLIDAIARIEPGLVQRTIERAHETLIRAGIDQPRIAVCGINPHAGENGLFGHGEEEEKIVPAIDVLKARGWDVEGPLPADTLFFRAGRGDFDCVVAMYHDQGHGPVKVMGLEAGVNVTVGLPVIRTSVDHGTAFDIAGQGMADERSMLEALRQAVELASRQRETA
ncbi:4-hydroxythreonine-4-phosphate dehydrogenase PdxA [Kushneria avicenniae]|uniref:4-hydroxythreonine-4-phosphate dehydrogenase PdxA n=1 Tax=Kushneria avicenniae TaxID=402385 RepID=UPI001C31954C|nr:4-hydroxythreonine-4-phosphate dehydrogenase PdxA [Kushneria avicenniae]